MLKTNEVYLGDCLEVMKDIDDKSIDMILCDLPYGTTTCKWDVIIPFEPLWEQYKRIIKNKGAIVLFGTEPFSSYLRLSNIKWYKYDWVWDKVNPTGFQISKYQPMRRIENICVFSSTATNYYPILEEAQEKNVRPKNSGTKQKTLDVAPIASGISKSRHDYDIHKRLPSNVIIISKFSKECNPIKKQRYHPTQKPVALFEYLIKTYTNENDIVLDNCAGSGTTAIACLNTNRNYILIEKEPNYVDICKTRTKTATQQ